MDDNYVCRPIPDSEFAEAEAEFLEEQRLDDARYEELREAYPADVRALYEVSRGRTGVAPIIVQILLALHRKRGPIEMGDLWRLDRNNRARVLRLIEAMMMASMVSDGGLTEGPDGKPLLTDAEIEALLADE